MPVDGMTTPPLRLAIVASHPTQYYGPWFRHIAQQGELDLRIFYLWNFGVAKTHDRQFGKSFAWDVDVVDGYAHEFVPNISGDPGTHHFLGLRNPTLTARLGAFRPQALLIFGYNYASHLRTILWARRRRIPLIFRGDSHFIGRNTPVGLRRLFLHLVYRQFAAVTYVGQSNLDYFRTLGVPTSRLFFAPHAVNDAFFNRSNREHRAAANALRTSLQLSPSTRVVLFAGKLLPAKQPRELLQAFMAIRAPGTALVFVGAGEEKSALLEQARSAEPGTVHFLPFANQSEMPARYLLADVFALPSRGVYETWGLAVNEAMHMGVPALVSDRVGCQRDLVSPRETGWVFSATDPDGLQSALAQSLTSVAEDREGYRQRVLSRISGYTYATASAGLMAAVRSTVSR